MRKDLPTYLKASVFAIEKLEVWVHFSSDKKTSLSSFDLLSSQDIFNALYAGLREAENAYRFLRGEIQDFSEYV